MIRCRNYTSSFISIVVSLGGWRVLAQEEKEKEQQTATIIALKGWVRETRDTIFKVGQIRRQWFDSLHLSLC